MPTSSSEVPTGRIARCAVLAPLLALAACGGGGSGPSAEFRPTIAQPAPPAAANGAIYQASQGYAPLTSGTRAAAVGDILTIVLMERTQASNENSATTERGGSIGLTPPASGPLAVLGAGDLNLGGDQSFSGRGQSTQSNRLSGEISVTIAEVYPNGTMLVRGEKQVRLNRGDEFIRISGLVRPSDISLDNRIASSRVADAQIVYSGRGEIARASAQGWLQRFFSRVSPF